MPAIKYSKRKPECLVLNGTYTKSEILGIAENIIYDQFKEKKELIDSPHASKRLLTTKLALRKNEVFAVIFLDVQNRVIACEELFYGTIDAAAVYPRVIAQRVLTHNASNMGSEVQWYENVR